MAKNEQSREANQPIWFDGKSINEALFCDDFLGRHKIIYTNGAFFTPDGRVTNDLPLRSEIFDELRCCAVSNIPRKISNIVELMKLMIEKGRYSKIDSVFEYFIGLVKEEKKIGIAYIATAVELSEAQKEAVMQRLLQTTKYESFEMNYQVDASLIGGMVIRIGDRVVDTSIKTKLYELSKSLKKIQV
mgnify:FL=1